MSNKIGISKKVNNVVLKHLPGQHNQKRHGWRYSGGLAQIRRGMRAGISEDFAGTTSADERDEYRDRISKLSNKPAGWKKSYVLEYERLLRAQNKPEYGVVTPKPKRGRPPGSVNKGSYVRAKFTDPYDFMDKMREVRENEKQGIGSARDDYLDAIYKMQGFDGKPAVINEKKMDSMKGVQLFRAIGNPDKCRAYQKGDYFVGTGIYGNGTYAATTIEDAHDYNDHTMKIKFNPKSNIGDMTTIYKKQSDFLADINNRISSSSHGSVERKKLQTLMNTASDIGRFAAMLGYDGYKTNSGTTWKGGEYYVILNRTATLVQNTFEMPDGTWAS